MSKISGYKYIRTVCCGTQYRHLNFSSISFQQDVYWTDGGGLRNSSLSTYGVKVCNCGEIFRIPEQIKLPIEICDTTNENTPQNASLDDMMRFLLKNEEANTDLVELVRRSMWRVRNDDFREAYIDKSNGAEVKFELDEYAKENIRKLIEFSLKSRYVNYFEIAELHRELGNFQEAREAASRIDANDASLRKVQLELIEKNIQQPTTYTP